MLLVMKFRHGYRRAVQVTINDAPVARFKQERQRHFEGELHFGLVYFRNTNTTGVADFQFIFGDPGDKLTAGDWDGDGDDTVGVYRPSNGMFYVRNSNTQGNADATFPAGSYDGVIALTP